MTNGSAVSPLTRVNSQERPQPFRRCRFLMRQDMGLCAECDARVAVPESGGDGLDGRSACQIEGRADVPEVVQPHPQHAGAGDGVIEAAAHVAGRERCPNTGWELEAGFLPVRRTQFTLSLPNLMLPHSSHRIWREPHRAERRLALWSLDDRFASQHHERLLDREPSRVKIEVLKAFNKNRYPGGAAVDCSPTNDRCESTKTVNGDIRCVDYTDTECPTRDECDNNRNCRQGEVCAQVGDCCRGKPGNLCVPLYRS